MKTNAIQPRTAFTLLELMVTVAILSILAAIALPNYREAQVRAQVSAAESNARTVLAALEVYATDHNAYPPTRPVFPHDPLGLFADVQLDQLREPVAYLSGGNLTDPFGDARMQNYFKQNNPRWSSPNPTRSLLYYNYRDLADSWHMPCLALNGAAIVSLGPGRTDSLGAYRPFGMDCFGLMYEYSNMVHHPVNTVYDPTNGLLSDGDIGRYAGEAARFVH